MTTTETPRLPFYRLAPGIHGPLLALTRAAKKDLDPTLVELLLIRASQLNHCAFCLDMHVTDARKGRRPTSGSPFSAPGRKPPVSTPPRSRRPSPSPRR